MCLLQGDIHFDGDDEALDEAIDVGAFIVMSNGGGIFVTHVIHGKGDGLVAIITKVVSFNVLWVVLLLVVTSLLVLLYRLKEGDQHINCWHCFFTPTK